MEAKKWEAPGPLFWSTQQLAASGCGSEVTLEGSGTPLVKMIFLKDLDLFLLVIFLRIGILWGIYFTCSKAVEANPGG